MAGQGEGPGVTRPSENGYVLSVPVAEPEDTYFVVRAATPRDEWPEGRWPTPSFVAGGGVACVGCPTDPPCEGCPAVEAERARRSAFGRAVADLPNTSNEKPRRTWRLWRS